MAQRVCLVTAEFHGLFKNGGIGTANTGLALSWRRRPRGDGGLCRSRRLGDDADERSPAVAQRARWRERGVYLDVVPRWPRAARRHEDIRWAVSTCCEYLQARGFDVVLFNECGGQGYYALLAKRAGAVRRRAAHDRRHPRRQRLGARAQRAVYCQLCTDRAALSSSAAASNSPTLVSPSRYLVGWMRDRGWRLPAETRCCKTSCRSRRRGRAAPRRRSTRSSSSAGSNRARASKSSATPSTSSTATAGSARSGVTFLGKFSRVGSVHSGVFVLERSREWRVAPTLLAELGQEQALEYLSRPGVLAVMPSLAENSPCVVAECLIAGVPFVATDSGGTAELVAEADRAPLPRPARRCRARRAASRDPGAAGHGRARMARAARRDTSPLASDCVERADAGPRPPTSRARVCRLPVRPRRRRDRAGRRWTPSRARPTPRSRSSSSRTAREARPPLRARSRAEIRIERRPPDRAAAPQRRGRRGRRLADVRARSAMVAGARRVATLAARGRAARRRGDLRLRLRAQRAQTDFRHWDGELAALPFGPSLELAAFENSLGDEAFLISRRAFEALGGYESGVSPAIEDRLLLTRAIALG